MHSRCLQSCRDCSSAVALMLLVAMLGAGGCSPGRSPAKSLVLATTTSAHDSGLLDALLPAFEKDTLIEVKVVAVGSGQAIELGRRGDADVILAHSPALEEQFVAEGFAERRRPVMHNDFILVGPPDVQLRSREGGSAAQAMAEIAERELPFVSRGDESGTHHKEKELWRLAGTEPRGEWYIRAGLGMAAALRMADEKRALVLVDRGTWLSHRASVQLAIAFENVPPLENHYSVMVVGTQRHPNAREADGRRLADFLTAPATQELIGRFGVEQFGQPLFHPDAENQGR